MKCPMCGKENRAVRVIPAGNAGKAIERRCPEGHRHVYAVQLVGEIRGRGDGPSAIASRMARGENPVPAAPGSNNHAEEAEN